MGFPASIDTFRDKENLPGLVYDADDKRTFFVEDIVAVQEAIIAIETALGTPFSLSDFVKVTGNQTIGGVKTLTDQLLLNDGTAGTPALSFSSDPNTGIYHSASDVLNIATGGSSRLRIASSLITAGTPILVPDQSTTVPAYRIGNSSSGLFGSQSQGRIGLKMSNIVIFDAILSAGLGASKFKYIPLKAEAGFSAGLYEAVDEDFIYVSSGSLNTVDTSGGAINLYLGDDISDPLVADNLEGAEIVIKDSTGNAGTNNITIDPRGLTIDGGTLVTIDTNYGYVKLSIMDSKFLITGGFGYTLT